VKAGWKLQRLGDLCAFDKSQGIHTNLPYVGLEHIESDTGQYLGNLEPTDVKSSTFKFNDSHVLYGRLRPYLNKVLLPDFEGHCSTEIFPIQIKPGLLREYLGHWLMSESVVESINTTCTGARMPRADMNAVLEFNIPVPSEQEQRRIVTLLDEAFADIATAKANAEKNLQNAREIFETHLRNLLNARTTDGIETTLQKCCDQIFAGGDVPKDRVSNERTSTYPIPIFSNGAKDDGLYGFTDTARVTKPSVTVSARGTLGFSAIRNEPFLPVVRLIVLTPNENLIDLSFLHYTVLGMDFENTGTSIPQLTVPNFKDLSIYLPPLEKQKELVLALDSIRDEIQNLESIYRQKLTSLDDLKKSLLHQAFSGLL
jgi:type I restriction enzyme, S subunit